MNSLNSLEKAPKYLFTVDNGNTNPNVGCFPGAKNISDLKLQSLPEWREQWGGASQQSTEFDFRIMVSNVGGDINWIDQLFPGKRLDLLSYKKEKNFLGMPFNYASTIGDDRLFESYYLYRNRNCDKRDDGRMLLIDMGTFTTIDVISSTHGIEGGYIFPGPRIFLESYRAGAQLPLLTLPDDDGAWRLQRLKEQQQKDYWPHTTAEAITGAYLYYERAIIKLLLQDLLQRDQSGGAECNEIHITGGGGAAFLPLLKQEMLQLQLQGQVAAQKLYYHKHLIHHALLQIYNDINDINNINDIA
ncbi:MAG: type III pantothenate kinase [Oligoflexia bacterium]|nr:type III pantothenate kinase [Oligoflexia bacterium]